VEDTPLTRPLVLSLVGFVATIVIVTVGGIVLANKFHTDEYGTTAVLGGIALLGATLLRPTFFWYHAKVLFVRGLIGDKGAAAFYIVLSVGLGLVGANRLTYWKAAAAMCSRQYESAADSHQRMQVLQSRPDTTLRGVVGVVGKPQSLTCGRYRDKGAF
jgi:hypothetical protein